MKIILKSKEDVKLKINDFLNKILIKETFNNETDCIECSDILNCCFEILEKTCYKKPYFYNLYEENLICYRCNCKCFQFKINLISITENDIAVIKLIANLLNNEKVKDSQIIDFNPKFKNSLFNFFVEISNFDTWNYKFIDFLNNEEIKKLWKDTFLNEYIYWESIKSFKNWLHEIIDIIYCDHEINIAIEIIEKKQVDNIILKIDNKKTFLNIIEEANYYLKNKDYSSSLKKIVDECYPIILDEFGLSQQKGKTKMFDKIKENLPNDSIFSNELKHFENFIKNIGLIRNTLKSPTEALTNDSKKEQNLFNSLSDQEKNLYIATLIDTYKMFFNFALRIKKCNFS